MFGSRLGWEKAMPRKDLRTRILKQRSMRDSRKNLYEEYGIVENPFPSAEQTSGHPRMPTEADDQIDAEIEQFYRDKARKSHVIVVTASQGIGKTNLLNAYERELRDIFEPLRFFIIRYIPDPEPSFDPLIRTMFDALGEDHLGQLANALTKQADADIEFLFANLKEDDMKRMLRALRKAAEDGQPELDNVVKCAQEWLLGFRVLKIHRETIGIRFRLDTVESKTRALRDLVAFSYSVRKLEGIFLLLDELEKQGSLLSKTMVLRYLSALRALIDALPQNLFLMAAVTTDALDRYGEMFPALRGRLANEVELRPLQNREEAIELYRFYQNEARNSARQERLASGWKQGSSDIVPEEAIPTIFQRLDDRDSTIEGVRQRDFLNEMHRRAQEVIDQISQTSSSSDL